jgi:hypothetical protein
MHGDAVGPLGAGGTLAIASRAPVSMIPDAIRDFRRGVGAAAIGKETDPPGRPDHDLPHDLADGDLDDVHRVGVLAAHVMPCRRWLHTACCGLRPLVAILRATCKRARGQATAHAVVSSTATASHLPSGER